MIDEERYTVDREKISALAHEMEIVIVTGYSGAGKNSVLHALEDNDFYCVDNLPLDLLNSFFHLLTESHNFGQRIALGLDVRSISDARNLVIHLQVLRATCPHLKVIFLTSSSSVLIKRFQETRRKHPLAHETDLFDAIIKEQQLLQPLIDTADVILDTDQLNIHELRHFIATAFATTDRKIVVSLISFGFKYGVPPESNYVYDLRSLPNPYFIPELKGYSGTDDEIQEYLFTDQSVKDYWQHFIMFATYAIEKSYQEGRFFMNIAIGCTGGRHRSVAFVHRFAQTPLSNAKFIIKHRDINRDVYVS